MKIATYSIVNGVPGLGVISGNALIPLSAIAGMPTTMIDLIRDWSRLAGFIDEAVSAGAGAIALSDVKLLAPFKIQRGYWQ